VRSEVTQQAVEEIYKEIKRLGAEPVPDDEMHMVRNYMLGTFMRNIDGAFHLSDRCKSIVLFDLGLRLLRKTYFGYTQYHAGAADAAHLASTWPQILFTK
jgi:hypothetical protein